MLMRLIAMLFQHDSRKSTCSRAGNVCAYLYTGFFKFLEPKRTDYYPLGSLFTMFSLTFGVRKFRSHHSVIKKPPFGECIINIHGVGIKINASQRPLLSEH